MTNIFHFLLAISKCFDFYISTEVMASAPWSETTGTANGDPDVYQGSEVNISQKFWSRFSYSGFAVVADLLQSITCFTVCFVRLLLETFTVDIPV